MTTSTPINGQWSHAVITTKWTCYDTLVLILVLAHYANLQSSSWNCLAVMFLLLVDPINLCARSIIIK